MTKLNWVWQSLADGWYAYIGEYGPGQKSLYGVRGSLSEDLPYETIIDGDIVASIDPRTLIDICNRHYEAKQ